MKEIKLTKGKVAIVDDADYRFLAPYKWYAHKRGNTYYAVRCIWKPKRQFIRMHRIIMNPPEGTEVDHIDCDGLNNRRLNLRLCNHNENQRHQQLRCDNKTGFKGVSYINGSQQTSYRAYIAVNNKYIHIGCYPTAEKAARAYDLAAVRYHREFALTNRMLGLL